MPYITWMTKHCKNVHHSSNSILKERCWKFHISIEIITFPRLWKDNLYIAWRQIFLVQHFCYLYNNKTFLLKMIRSPATYMLTPWHSWIYWSILRHLCLHHKLFYHAVKAHFHTKCHQQRLVQRIMKSRKWWQAAIATLTAKELYALTFSFWQEHFILYWKL